MVPKCTNLLDGGSRLFQKLHASVKAKKNNFITSGFLVSGLIEELPVLVSSEERVSDLRQLLLSNHGKAGLQSVAHLDLGPLSEQLNTSGTEKRM